MSENTSPVLQFGHYRLDAMRRVLYRDDSLVALRPKALSLLLVLVENRDRVVSKQELMDSLWPDGFGTEANLTVNIAAVRRALGEDPRDHDYIVTVPTEGYRFVAEVEPMAVNGSRPVEILDAQLVRHLAVLPFRVLAAKTTSEQAGSVAADDKTANNSDVEEVLGFGIADALVDRLQEVEGLSLRSYGNPTHLYPTAVGQKLQVEAVLTGTLRVKESVVDAELVMHRSLDGHQLWTTRLSHPRDDLQTLAERLQRRVVAALLLDSPRGRGFALRYTEDPVAFDRFVSGRYQFCNNTGIQGLEKAAEQFRAALDIDPDYALAWSGLAEVYLQLWTMGFVQPSELMDRTRDAALRALEIDPHLAEAHRAMGLVLMMLERDWEAARQHLEVALQHQPQNSLVHGALSYYWNGQGNTKMAVASARRARELDANSLIALTDLGLAYYFARQFESAAECYDTALSLGPDYEMALVLNGWLGLGTDDPERALYYFKRLHEIAGPVAWSENLLSSAHALAGNGEEAEHYHRRVIESHSQDFVPPFFHAIYHRCAGDHEAAVKWLEKADHGRYGYIAFICVEPVWDPLHDHPGYQEICRRVRASKSS